jgi:hypothetical protein
LSPMNGSISENIWDFGETSETSHRGGKVLRSGSLRTYDRYIGDVHIHRYVIS